MSKDKTFRSFGEDVDLEILGNPPKVVVLNIQGSTAEKTDRIKDLLDIDSWAYKVLLHKKNYLENDISRDKIKLEIILDAIKEIEHLHPAEAKPCTK